MKKFAVIAAMFLLGGCTRAAPDAGEEGVLISKPWLFGHGGVAPEPVKTGLTFVAWTTSVVYINVMPTMVKERFDDMMSKDGVPLSCEIAGDEQRWPCPELQRRSRQPGR